MSLRIEQYGRVRRITLADSARRNVINASRAADLLGELAQADADSDTGAVLLDADGQVFCGGVELVPELPAGLFTFGCQAKKPVIAAIQGVAISAGLALLANAHIVVAAQGSSFGLTDIREGQVHPGILQSVARAIGQRRTQELALTGRIFSTNEALNWGLVHAVTPAFEFDDRASAIARGVANASPAALAAILECGR